MDVGGDIRLGSMLFTLVEPHRGHEVAYNRWYERDHFYAGCMVGPWLFAGRRFVATKALKDLRFPIDPPMFGDARLGSYLGIYWMLDGKRDEHVTWALDQVHGLHAAGRMFAERDHIHTLLYRYAGVAHRDPDGVPPELALDHPFRGLQAVMVERTGDAPPTPPHLMPGSAAAMVLTFDPVRLPEGAPVTQPSMEGIERRQLQLWFLDTEPEDHLPGVAAYGAWLADEGTGRIVWAAPFIPTVPGTDRYADALF
jgi:hypothetical protein